MKIAVLGIGVIGTTYAYAFQKAGHEIKHIVRETRRASAPKSLKVHLLDGRYDPKGKYTDDIYEVDLADRGEEFDYILISVASGKLAEAVQTIRDNELKGSLILFCNFWNERSEVEAILGDLPYVTAFPTAGGKKDQELLDCVLFDHIMLESEEKSRIPNYQDLMSLLTSSDLKAEVPKDMFEWIWIHMAINAGVTSTAARGGDISDPNRLARELMADSRALSIAVRCIRETLKVAEKRGVVLKDYNSEILPYKMPAKLAGVVMKKMFAGNELTSRIMTLHNDVNDILYGCRSVYDEGKKQGLELPLFYGNMERVFHGMEGK